MIRQLLRRLLGEGPAARVFTTTTAVQQWERRVADTFILSSQVLSRQLAVNAD